SNLLDKTGTKAISADEAETLARRLARLNQQLTPEERDRLAQAAGGTSLFEIAGGIMRAADPDHQEEVEKKEGRAAARRLIEDAIAPLTGNPELRRFILEIRRDKDYVFDETTRVSIDEMVEVPREQRAREEVDRWKKLLEDERDRITAIRVALDGPRSVSPGEAYAALKELAREIERPQYAWTPQLLWSYYEDLGAAVEQPGREAGVPDLISLIRYELGVDEELRPYRETVEERFEAWLLRQQQAGADFSDDQMWWLRSICNVVISDAGIGPKDINAEPFREKGGGRGFMHAF